MDRVIGRHLKPLLMRALIGGKLKAGSTAIIDLAEGTLQLSVQEPQPEKEKKQRKAKATATEKTLQPAQETKVSTSSKQSPNKEEKASPDKKKKATSKPKKQDKKSKQE